MDRETGEFYQALGQRIRQAREQQRLTQDSLARKVEISRPSLANIEKGRQAVAAHTLVRLADELRLGVADLIPERGTLQMLREKIASMGQERPSVDLIWMERIINRTGKKDAE